MKYFQASCVNVQVPFARASYQAKRAVHYCGKSSQVKPVAFLVLWVFQEDPGRGHWKVTRES